MKKLIKMTLLALTAFLVLTGAFYNRSITVEAASKTTTTTSVKKSKRVVKLKKKAKTRTIKKVSIRKHTKKITRRTEIITKVTTVKKTVITKFKAKKKTINTTVKTTVRTTTVKKTATKKTPTKTPTPVRTNSTEIATTMTIDSLNGLVDPIVIKAFKTMNYRIIINSNVSYAGFFNGKEQTITLRSANQGYLLHELGHYVSFIAGFKDSTSEFKSIYAKEASKYTGTNKIYVTKSSAEYFAESFRDLYTRPATLRAERPETYAYIRKTIAGITDERINYVNGIYYS